MKLIRPLLIGTGILAVLLAVTLVLAFLPSVQTWAARRVIDGNPSLGVTHLGRVSAGFNRIEITDVAIARDGLSAHLPSVVIEMPLLAAAKNDVQLRRLVAKGWTVDLSSDLSPGSAPSTTTGTSDAKPFTFEGVFKLLQLPVDLVVESADIDGLVIFPIKPGQPAGRASVKISGGQLGTGRQGKFTIAAETTLPDGLAPVSRLTTTTTLALSMDTPRTFNRVAATIDSYAIGPGVPQGARLLSESSASRESNREAYEMRVKSITPAGEKCMVDVAASNRPGEPFSGTWKFDVSDTDLTPFTLGRLLPQFTLGATGTFEADRHLQEIKLAGKTDLAADQLDAVYAGLSTLGRLHVLTDFDVVHRQTALRVNRLTVDVNGQQPVASVKVLQALEVVPATGEIKVAAPETDLVRVSLMGVPLSWTRLVAPADLSLAGEPLRGELVARADQGGVAVRSVSPLLLKNLTVIQSGKTLAKALDLSISAAGSHAPAGWQADVSEITAHSGGASLFTLSTRAGQSSGKDQPIKATGRLRADLPAILAQPAVEEFRVLGGGAADVEFTASVTSALQQISSKLSLSGLRTNDGKSLPSVSGDLRADVHPDGRIEVNAPLVFDFSGRRSDLEVSGTVKTEKASVALNAEVISRELYVEDLKSFASIHPSTAPAIGPAKPVPAPGPKAPAPQSKPIWDGVTGLLKLALKKVVYAQNQPPVEVSSTVRITPEALTLESLNAVFPDGAAAKVDALIKFEPAVAEPYDVKANVSATNFDPEPFLKAANPGKSPTVEGKFDLTGKFFGRTSSLDKITDTASVDAQLVSREGTFYGFETSALAAATLGKIPDAGSKVTSLLSIAGSVLGKSELTRAAEKSRAISDTVKRLGNFSFDQLNVDIAHRPGQSATEIKNFSIISPDLRFLGAGSIDSAGGWIKILQGAMKLDLQMAVRGAQAEDLRILDMLKREPDALGYIAVLENFTVKGTPGQMDATSFFQTLAAQAKK